MKVIIDTEKNFEGEVFGAHCFLEYFPEIKSTGIIVEKFGDRWYVMNSKGNRVHNTCFFTEEEMIHLKDIS